MSSFKNVIAFSFQTFNEEIIKQWNTFSNELKKKNLNLILFTSNNKNIKLNFTCHFIPFEFSSYEGFLDKLSFFNNSKFYYNPRENQNIFLEKLKKFTQDKIAKLYFIQMLEYYKPSFLIFWSPNHNLSRLYKSYSDKMGIPSFFLERGFFDGTWEINIGGMELYQDNFYSFKTLNLYNSIDINKSDKISKLKKNLKKKIDKTKIKFKKNIKELLKIKKKHKVLLLIGQHDNYAGFDEDSNFLNKNSTCYKGTLEAYEALRKFVNNSKENFFLIFKPHPSESINKYNFNNEEKIKIVNTNIDILINYSDLVLSLNSTSVYKALLIEKKILFLNNHFLAKTCNFEIVHNHKELKKKINISLKKDINKKLINKFLSIYINHFAVSQDNNIYENNIKKLVCFIESNCLNKKVEKKKKLNFYYFKNKLVEKLISYKKTTINSNLEYSKKIKQNLYLENEINEIKQRKLYIVLNIFSKILTIYKKYTSISRVLVNDKKNNKLNQALLNDVLKDESVFFELRQQEKLSRYQGLDVSNLNTDDEITVCIPTLNAGFDFKYVLNSIISQNCKIKEILILDSGSSDKTIDIAKSFGCKIFKIAKQNFTHASARNLLLKKVTTKFVYFTVQDAILSNKNILSKMLKQMSLNNISAISDYQIPRSKADQYCFFINNIHNNYFYNFAHNKFKIFENSNLVENNFQLLRESCQLDNVTCLYNVQDLREISFKGVFAEDLIIGIEFLKRKKKIARSKFGPVIHSHSRSQFYHHKRSFVEHIAMNEVNKSYIESFEYQELNKDINIVQSLKIAVYILKANNNLDLNNFEFLKINTNFGKKISLKVIYDFIKQFYSRKKHFQTMSKEKLYKKTLEIIVSEIAGKFMANYYFGLSGENKKLFYKNLSENI